MAKPFFVRYMIDTETGEATGNVLHFCSAACRLESTSLLMGDFKDVDAATDESVDGTVCDFCGGPIVSSKSPEQSYNDYLDLIEYAEDHIRSARGCSDARKSKSAHESLSFAITRLTQARAALERHEACGWLEDCLSCGRSDGARHETEDGSVCDDCWSAGSYNAKMEVSNG